MTEPRPLPPSFFVLRHPALPFDVLEAWCKDAPVPLGERRAELRRRLLTLVERPEVRQAIELASPALLSRLPAWRDAPTSEAGAKVERALVRYLSRMGGRPTPFGLFAASALGTVGPTSQLVISPRAALRRVTRVAPRWVEAVARRHQARFFPNATVYRSGTELRGYASDESGGFRFFSVGADAVLLELLEKAAVGLTLSGCVESVRLRARVRRPEAEAYVAQLLETGLLRSELEPSLTCRDPLQELLVTLRAGGNPEPKLEASHRQLAELDSSPAPQPLAAYTAALAELTTAVPVTSSEEAPIYADLYDPAAPVLGASLTRALQEVARVLTCPRAEPAPLAWLAPHVQRFQARFGEGELRLVDVFDPGMGFVEESGLATDSEALTLPRRLGVTRAASSSTQPEQSVFARALAEKLVARPRASTTPLHLTAADLESISPARPRAHPSFLMLGAALQHEGEGTRSTLRAQLRFASSRGIGALARFAHGSPELEAHLKHQRQLEAELLAPVRALELVHRSSTQHAHLLTRPSLDAGPELMVLGRSGLSAENTLPLRDLFVCVRDGRFLVRSQRLGCEVRLTVSSAFDLSREEELPVVRFLSWLGNQQTQAEWQSSPACWGTYQQLGFLPRVLLDGVVLLPAMWRVLPEHAQRFTGEADADHARLQALRSELGLPRWVRRMEGEDELPVDLDNPLAVDGLVHDLRQSRGGRLAELFLQPEAVPVASGPDGKYLHHLLIPFALAAEPTASTEVTLAWAPGAAPRRVRHLPGSRWLYAKVYASATNGDRFLLERVRPLLRKEGAQLSRWFFLRYQDPDEHLRLRFRVENRRQRERLLEALSRATDSAVRQGWVTRLELGTWEPELERYGGTAGHELAERWFHHDSVCALELLRVLGPEQHALRWKAALAGVLGQLNAAQLTSEQQLERAGHLARGYAHEFERAQALPDRLSALFRELRPELELLLEGTTPDPKLARALRLLQARDDQLRPLGVRLNRLAKHGKLLVSVDSWAESQVHLHVNRMVSTAAREHEVAIYDLLARLLRSRAARSRAQ